jgi:CheY-like chemotaxis protein
MPKVLIIDDNVDHIRMTSRVLARKGYQVLTAADGETGLDVAISDRPDVILLDLGLPDVDGQTLVGWLRREPELQGVPIVAVTAWPDDVAAQMVAAYGFDGYISKPIQFALLSDQVAAYLLSDAS